MRLRFDLLLASLLPLAAHSLFSEDAGLMDFVVSTPGHGVTRQVHAHQDSLLTTDASSVTNDATSCYVASRKTEDGSLDWRRNVCSSQSDQQRHDLAIAGDYFYTMDDTGILRAWTAMEGSLVWESQVTPASKPRVWAFSRGGKNYVAAASEGEITIVNAETGSQFDTINTIAALESTPQKLKSKETVQVLSIVPEASTDGSRVLGLVAFAQPDGTATGNRILAVEMEVGNDRFLSAEPLNHVRAALVTSSVQVQRVGSEWHGLGLTQDSSAVHFSLKGGALSNNLPASSWNPSWKEVVSIQSTPNSAVVSVQGVDGSANESMGLFRFDAATKSGWEKLRGLDDPADKSFRAMAYCPEAEIVVALVEDSLLAYRHDSMSSQADAKADRRQRLSPLTAMAVRGDNTNIPSKGSIESLSVVGCTTDSVTALLSTSGGTTTQFTLAVQDGDVTSEVGWTAEDGLGTVSAGIMLDASHLGSDDLVEEQDVVLDKLSLPSRLAAQWEGVVSLLSPDVKAFNRQDHTFGFVKVAALLSQSSHRIWGLKTWGEERGSVMWSIDLPRSAAFHSMVHGTTNSETATHGINGGTHSREILVLSPSKDSIDWKCIDGTNGDIHSEDSVAISSPVSQIIPMYGSSGGCRQASLILHEDHTLSVVPADQDSMDLVRQQMEKSSNGLFTHVVNKGASNVESFQVAENAGKLVPIQVGRTSFSGERIVKVAYPIRDEVVQTMCTVLGDNSLLLKYVNPHMAVVMTVSEEDQKSASNLASSLDKQQGQQTRKPAGAGDAAEQVETKADLAVPNLFVNVIDTVSGRVLHRSGHAGADPARDMTALITENWVVYTYVNSKTRRTEVGVLTLHEGMIDSKGIGPFTSPEQTTTFSSLNARESKPVVLSKTYTYPQHVTALGVTATRGGISSRTFLFASADGKITTVNHMMLETRRPVGQVKEAEKKEGLFPYAQLVMQVPKSVMTHNQTVDSMRSVISAPTALESQSLVFAFGGPDLFFARTSPSKGFDLLPESFSRPLVSIVSIALVVVLLVVKHLGTNKAMQQWWL